MRARRSSPRRAPRQMRALLALARGRRPARSCRRTSRTVRPLRAQSVRRRRGARDCLGLDSSGSACAALVIALDQASKLWVLASFQSRREPAGDAFLQPGAGVQPRRGLQLSRRRRRLAEVVLRRAGAGHFGLAGRHDAPAMQRSACCLPPWRWSSAARWATSSTGWASVRWSTSSDFHVGRYHWPAFNVADSAITVGVALLLWHQFAQQKQP